MISHVKGKLVDYADELEAIDGTIVSIQMISHVKGKAAMATLTLDHTEPVSIQMISHVKGK